MAPARPPAPSLRSPRRLLRLAALLAWIALAAPAAAAPPAASDGPTELPRAAVTVQHRSIVAFRAPLMGYSAEERARSVEARIYALVEAGRSGAVTVADIPQGKVIKIGDQVAFALTPEDLDPIAGETLEAVSEKAAQALTLVLRDELDSRSLKTLLLDGAAAAVATLLYALLLALVARVARWLLARMGTLIDRQATRLTGLGLAALPQAVARIGRWLVGAAWGLVGVVATYGWLTFCLSRFPYTRAWGEALAGFVLGALRTVALGLIGWVPGLFFVAAIFTATTYLNRGVQLIFDAIAAGRIRVPVAFAETAQPTRKMVSLCLWLFALVMAYPYLPGSGTEAFKGISVFVGLVVSLGGTGVMGHATSGMVLMYSRALRPGDYIRVGEHEGTVISLGTLSTKVRTPWLEEVNIPNLLLAGATMTNYSRAARETGVVLHTMVTIGFDAPWRQVHAMLLDAADRTAGLHKVPRPYVLQMALSDFYVEYKLCAYLEQPDRRIPVLGELHANIQDAFNEQGVQIMSPHYFADPAEPKVVPPERWNPAPAKRPG